MEEEWRPWKYEIEASSLGRVRVRYHGTEYQTKYRYPRLRVRATGDVSIKVLVSLGNRKTFLVHRIVWEAFRGDIPQDWEVHHRNKNRSDNRLENLDCLSKSEHLRLHVNERRLDSLLDH